MERLSLESEQGSSPEQPKNTPHLLRLLGIEERFSAVDAIREGVPAAIALVAGLAAGWMVLDSMRDLPAMEKVYTTVFTYLGVGGFTYGALRHPGDLIGGVGDCIGVLADIAYPTSFVAGTVILGGVLGIYGLIGDNNIALAAGFGFSMIGFALARDPRR